jgi:hypothetical protein
MKRVGSLIFSLMLVVSLVGFVYSANGSENNNSGNPNSLQTPYGNLTSEQVQNIIQERNRFRIHANGTSALPSGCVNSGSTTQCELQNGKTLTIQAGNSGNTIYQVKGFNMSTSVELYKGEDGVVYGKFGNITRAVNYLPDEIQERVQERLRVHVNSTEIELDEDGIYQVQAQKRARLFGIIPVQETTRLQVDSETGEVLRQYNSWWSFLASDEESEEMGE